MNFPSVTDIPALGDTPLLEVQDMHAALGKTRRIFAKAEWNNPGGSVKDRTAYWIIRDAERTGALAAGKTLLDATSGNTGIAYAWLGARLGYKVMLCVPASVSPERRRILQAYGAEIVFTDPLEGSDGAIRKARQLYAERPDLYYYADQYNNPANWRAHYETTAKEIWEQTEGAVTHFVAGLGTSGTFMGTGRRLRQLKAAVHLVSVEPAGPLHGLEGLKHMATAIVPGIYDKSLADEAIAVTTEEAQAACRAFARLRGVLIGPSGGANLAASLQVIARLDSAGLSGTVVTLFPDSGERYLSESFWKEGVRVS